MTIKYSVFKTDFGYFSIIGDSSGLIATTFGHKTKAEAKNAVFNTVKGLKTPDFRLERGSFGKLEDQIFAYFDGKNSKFDFKISKNLKLSAFKSAVLKKCMQIPAGKTITYKNLAKKACSPNASRAAGNVMASNTLPILIPCHRVIKSDGSFGRYSAIGGTETKAKLLKHEKDLLP